MRLLFTLGLITLPCLTAAYTVDPPSTAAPDTIEDCTLWQVAVDGDTCPSIEEYRGITNEQFLTYNPSLAGPCDLTTGNSYCVEKNWGIPDLTSSAVPSPAQTPAPVPTGNLEVCQGQAGGYASYCGRCLFRCESQTTYVKECYYSTFGTISYYDNQCWQQGGRDCADRAVDIVCPRT